MLRSSVVVLLSVSATAQVTIRGVATRAPTGVSVQAEPRLGQFQRASQIVPPLRDLTNGQRFATTVGTGQCSVSDALTVTWTGAELTLRRSYRIDARSCRSAEAKLQGDLAIALRMPRPTAGHFVPLQLQTGLNVQLEIEGVSRFGCTYRLDRLVLRDGTVIRARLSGTAQIGPKTPFRLGVRNSVFRFRFVPDKSGIQTSGPACGAALVAGRFHTCNPFHRYRFTATGIRRGAKAFFVAGTRDLDIMVPPTGCSLRTDLALAVPVSVDPTGAARVAFTLPANMQSGAVNVQFLAGKVVNGAQSWWTTNAVKLIFP